uniref:type IX secretion/gliding motility protein PorT/SprT n=1 Tax=Fibrella aquatilis TaxID=2817059 RepID=UPI00286DEF30|nr:outer membrane beta-barrel protein [Fibrella aquatilis]
MAAQTATAQSSTYKYTRKFKEDYDFKPIHFGFYFGLPTTRYGLTYAPAFATATPTDPNPVVRITSPNNMGLLRVGFLVNAFLDDNFDLRTNPGISIISRSINYTFADGTEKANLVESAWVELPLLLKYKSARRVNSRMYLIGGASLGIETNRKRREDTSQGLPNTASTDLSLEYGVGFEQFLEYFKFAPELRFSHSLVNAFKPGASTPAAANIQRLTTHTITLYLNFE